MQASVGNTLAGSRVLVFWFFGFGAAGEQSH